MSLNVIRGPWYRPAPSAEVQMGGRWKLEAVGLLTLFKHGDIDTDGFILAMEGALKRFPPEGAPSEVSEVAGAPSPLTQWPRSNPG